MAQIYVAGIHTDAGKTHFSAAFCYAFRKYSYFKLIQAGEPTDTSRVKEILDFAFDFEKKAGKQGGQVKQIKQDFGVQDFDIFENFNNLNLADFKADFKDFDEADSRLQDLSKQDFMPPNHQTKLHKEGIKLATPASPHIAKMRENLQYNGLEIPLPNLSENPHCIIELAGGLYTPIDDKHCMIDFMRANPRECVLVGRYYLGCINHILLSLQTLKNANINTLCVAMSGEKLSTKSKQTQNPKSINDNDLSDNDLQVLIDDFVAKYAGVSIVHLPYFENPKDFMLSAKTLKNEMLQKIDFRF